MRLHSAILLLFAMAPWLGAAVQSPALRLGDQVKPVHYALHLTLDPVKDDFQGTVEIAIEVRESTPLLWLNATGLTIEDAGLAAGGKTWKASVMPGGDDFVGFSWQSPVPAGAATLHIAYHGKVDKEARDGLFVVAQGGEKYLYTQFESISARRAFPCFDEPGFKVPWQVTLDVPADAAAFSNTPVVSETPGQAGRKTVRFGETKPLPSYLVAFAVGPFEVVNVGKFGRKHTPIRIVVPKGRKSEARYAAQAIPELFTRLEDYFDIPYAYEKLDAVAVPLFGGEAMENAGMITYSDTTLLRNPERESDGWREELASVAAHEMAHQWFGDLVTMAWWNDTWLNEAFATWMSDHIVNEWKPEWRWDLHRFQAAAGAANTDGLASARRITQPVDSKSDIANAFDGITYSKGGAVLGMFEANAGPAKFRAGVQKYLRAHAYGNGRTEDFLAALSSTAGPEIGPAFRTFLDQPGIPEVSASLRCAAGSKPVVELRQRRSEPLGAKLAAETWQIPICLRYGSSSTVAEQCTMLDSAQAEVTLEKASSCPDWLLPNTGAKGYYRVKYTGDSLHQLIDRGGSKLSIVEQVSVLTDAQALVRTGAIPAGAALSIVPPSAQSTESDVVRAAIRVVTSLDQIVPDSLVPNQARFIRKIFGERARKLGWTSAAGDDRGTRELRAALLPFVAINGKDAELGAAARDLALKWLTDRKAVPPEMVSPVLETAAHFGDRELFDKFRAAALAAKDPSEQEHLLGAMGNFEKPDIARTALEELTRGDFDLTVALEIPANIIGTRETRETAFDFITAHFDQLARPGVTLGGGEDVGAALVFVGQAFCSEEGLAKQKSFFEPRAGKFTGGPRLLAQDLEIIQGCIARKKAHEASLAAFYGQY